MNLPAVFVRAGAAWNGRPSELSKYIPEIEAGGLSVVGPVREDNQDSIHLPQPQSAPGSGLLFAVADGFDQQLAQGFALELELAEHVEYLIT